MKAIVRVLALAMLIAFANSACKKTITETQEPQGTPLTKPDSIGKPASHDSTAAASIPYPQATNSGCANTVSYGDTIIYPQPTTGGDYIVYPVNDPGSGHYLSWPEGLNLDANTGAIDVTKSETGARYSIGFVKSGTTDTCLTNIILAGAAYADSVYVLANNATTANPYFNADPNLTSVCPASGSPNGPGCQFDITGLANSQRIIVDGHTGIIDLKKSLAQGAFGIIPLNGNTVTTTITYQLNDNSNLATQKIQVKLMYFNRKSDIPTDLLYNVENKLNQIINQLLMINKNTGPRPPLIIVTRFN